VAVVKSAFYEITGVSLASASTNISLSLSGGTGSCSQSYDLDTTGQSNDFRILYDMTTCIDVSAGKSDNSRTLNITATGSSVFVFSAEIIITFQFTPPSVGGFQSTGNLISSTFDTTTTNGAAPNTIMFIGTVPGDSSVRFQIASSACENGKTNPPDCNAGDWDYVGPDGTNTSFYPSGGGPASSNTPIEIKPGHHNKRYFRYKVILDATTDQIQTPQVDDVIFNWAP